MLAIKTLFAKQNFEKPTDKITTDLYVSIGVEWSTLDVMKIYLLT